MLLRKVSFCLDKVDLLHRKDNSQEHDNLSNYNLIDLMLYVFYPTFAFSAPFVKYENFHLTFVSYSLSTILDYFKILSKTYNFEDK